jgi:prefoldin subunit 5
MDKLPLNQETMDILVANVIPTTKYFESRFDHMQYQIDEIKKYQEEFKKDVDKRFEQVDKRFEQVDKRFEQVDKRFQSLENKIVDLTLEIKELSKKQETTIRDYIIERDRHYDAKFNNLRNFNIAVISIVTGFALKFFGVLDKIF